MAYGCERREFLEPQICTREHECCVDGPCNGFPYTDPPSFQKELETLINKHSIEITSNTTDYILARYLTDCLDAFNRATIARDISRGRDKTDPCAVPECAGTEIVNATVPGPEPSWWTGSCAEIPLEDAKRIFKTGATPILSEWERKGSTRSRW